MADLQWDNVTPIEFEQFCLALVEVMGFTSVALLAGPGDRGQDITAFEPALHAGIEPGTRKWVFQCKHCKTLRKDDITRELANFTSQRLDTWNLITTATPTPEFRRWFEHLNDSLRYHFHIQAWWRSDLNKHTRQFSKRLVSTLSTDIVKAIGVDRVPFLRSPLVLSQVVKLCQERTLESVDRFAKSKYIPQLYVRRALTTELEVFHSSEAAISSRLKADILEFTKRQHTDIANHLSGFPLPEIDEKRRSDRAFRTMVTAQLADIRHPLASEVDPSLQMEAANFLGRIYADSQDWLTQLRVLLTSLVRLAEQLPDDRYVNYRSTHKEILVALEGLVSLLDAMPTREWPFQFGNTKTRITFGIFAPDYVDPMTASIMRLTRSLSRCRKPCLVVIDRAGGGKTNLLCDFALRASALQPTLLLFGKEYVRPPNGLVELLEAHLFRPLGLVGESPMDILDSVLGQSGTFLHLLIDGINENRDIPDLDRSIAMFLDWAAKYRIKVTITCRDIYWSFFSYGSWSHHVNELYQNQLEHFAIDEYPLATSRYFHHYHLVCELADQAQAACRHPLLLRFFCEAYGSIGGPEVRLGNIKDIRLKSLFDEYFQRKLAQMGDALGHRNSDTVRTFVVKFVAFMFAHGSNSVLSSQVEEATGDSDLSSKESLYLRLLDEDIIIEEEPTDDVATRRISFVYEEFMEYLLARTLLSMPTRFNTSNISDIFELLDESVMRWVNARGVAEYVALMALSEDHGYSKTDGSRFLSLMVSSRNKVWLRAFWAVVGKCSESDLNPELYDLFWQAVRELGNPDAIRDCLSAMSRYTEAGCEKLAAVLLWTVAVPKVITWSEFERLDGMEGLELDAIRTRVGRAWRSGTRYPYKDTLPFGRLLETVLPYLGDTPAKAIKGVMKTFGVPGKGLRGAAVLIRVIWRAFPAYQPMLINGLFSNSGEVREVCSERLKFLEAHPGEILHLAESLIEGEGAESIPLLRESILALRKRL